MLESPSPPMSGAMAVGRIKPSAATTESAASKSIAKICEGGGCRTWLMVKNTGYYPMQTFSLQVNHEKFYNALKNSNFFYFHELFQTFGFELQIMLFGYASIPINLNFSA